MLTCCGFMYRTIPRGHEERLVELGLTQSMMGGHGDAGGPHGRAHRLNASSRVYSCRSDVIGAFVLM